MALLTQTQIKKRRLKMRYGEICLACNNCDSMADFVIEMNGDITCAYCGDTKGNLENTLMRDKP